eukprot:5902697-Amphidinium_carterae.1
MVAVNVLRSKSFSHSTPHRCPMQTSLLRFAVPGAVGVFQTAEVIGHSTVARKRKGPTTGVTSAERDGRKILRSVDGGTAQHKPMSSALRLVGRRRRHKTWKLRYGGVWLQEAASLGALAEAGSTGFVGLRRAKPINPNQTVVQMGRGNDAAYRQARSVLPAPMRWSVRSFIT